MGTSQSSGGPGGGVPMVPSWPPDPPAGDPPAAAPPADGDEGAPGDADGSAPAAPTPPSAPRVVPIAPPARFAGTRRSIGDFARTGDERDMRRSLGHYVRTGYGGSNVTTQRFGSTAATAGALGGALAGVASGQPAAPGSPLDPALLAGR
jgi:hypothetical protein